MNDRTEIAFGQALVLLFLIALSALAFYVDVGIWAMIACVCIMFFLLVLVAIIDESNRNCAKAIIRAIRSKP